MKKIRHWLLPTVLLFIFLLCFGAWYFIFGFKTSYEGSHFNKANNATWLEHRWVTSEVSQEEISALVKKLQAEQITTIFVHVGPLNEDGQIDLSTYAGAREFAFEVHQKDKNIVVQAWLGQLRNKINLSRGEIRQNIADTAYKLIYETGFDGIHLNIEPTKEGDSEFIFLCADIRKRIGTTALFSVAIGELIPKEITNFLKNFADEAQEVWGYKVDREYNTEEYYRSLAQYVDQFAVMTYDTSIKDPEIFKWFVAQQVIHVTRAAPNKQIFVGVPTYEDIRENFNADVENMSNGLQGVIDGLNNFRSKNDAFEGVAIYAYWETNEQEWQQYDKLWLGHE